MRSHETFAIEAWFRLIVSKVAGEPLFAFLQQNIFAPLHMANVGDSDAAHLPAPDAAGYTRYGLGPVRPAVPEGAGWLYAAGELAILVRYIDQVGAAVRRNHDLGSGRVLTDQSVGRARQLIVADARVVVVRIKQRQ